MAGNKKIGKKNIDQLIDGLKECWPGFDMTRDELLNPTLNSVIKFYDRFIYEFGIKVDTIIYYFNQVKEYEDITYVYTLYSCANQLFQQLELNDSFSLCFTNFINPADDEKIVGRTSLFANFLYYVKLTSVDPILPLREKVLEEIDTLDDLKKEEKNLNEILKAAAFTKANNIEKLDNIKINNNTKRNRLIETQLESQELIKEIEDLKVKFKFNEDEKDRLMGKIEINMNRKTKLKSLVVDDHENVIAEKNNIDKELNDEEIQLCELMKNIELKTTNETNLIKTYETIKNLIENVNIHKLLDVYNSIEGNRKEKEKIKEIHASKNTENEERNLKDLRNHDLKELEEKLLAFISQSNIRVQTLQNEIVELNNEHDEHINQFEKLNDEAATLNKCLKYIRDCNMQCTQNIEKQHKLYETFYASILHAKESLNKKVVEVIDLMKSKGAIAKFVENSDEHE